MLPERRAVPSAPCPPLLCICRLSQRTSRHLDKIRITTTSSTQSDHDKLKWDLDPSALQFWLDLDSCELLIDFDEAALKCFLLKAAVGV